MQKRIMKIISYEAGPLSTAAYLAIDEATNKAVVIDVPPESKDLILKLLAENNAKVEAIFLTHSHWDHCAEAPQLKKELNIPVYVHKNDEYRLLDPMTHTIWPLPFNIEPLTPDKYFEDGQTIAIGNMNFEIRYTPGHTEGSVIIVEHKQKAAFTGDTIFNESVGRDDLPGGSKKALMDSINKQVLTLDDAYDLYPGHGPSTTVKHERTYNPCLSNEQL